MTRRCFSLELQCEYKHLVYPWAVVSTQFDAAAAVVYLLKIKDTLDIEKQLWRGHIGKDSRKWLVCVTLVVAVQCTGSWGWEEGVTERSTFFSSD